MQSTRVLGCDIVGSGREISGLYTLHLAPNEEKKEKRNTLQLSVALPGKD